MSHQGTDSFWRYYAFQLCFSQLFWIPVFYEVQRRLGLSDTEIFSINSLYQVAFCLLELPTGLFADVWGRRRCLVWGSLALAAAHLLPFVLPPYAGFLGLWLGVALARSFISGASSAYLYDYLKERGEESRYRDAEGKARALYLVGRIAGWAGVGFLMEWRPLAPYALTAVTALGAVYFARGLPPIAAERGGRAEPFRWREAFAQLELGRAARLAFGRPFFLFGAVQGIGLFVLARLQLEIFQPILRAKGFDAKWFGTLLAAVTVLEAVGAARPSLLRGRLSDLQGVFALTVAMGLLLAAVPAAGPWGAVALLGVFSLLTGAAFPIQRQLMNEAIPDSRYRATLLSFESILDRAAHAGLAFQVGVFLTAGQLDGFLLALGAGSVLFTGLLGAVWTARLRPAAG